MGDMNAAVESPVLRSVRDVLTDAWTAGKVPLVQSRTSLQPSLGAARGRT